MVRHVADEGGAFRECGFLNSSGGDGCREAKQRAVCPTIEYKKDHEVRVELDGMVEEEDRGTLRDQYSGERKGEEESLFSHILLAEPKREEEEPKVVKKSGDMEIWKGLACGVVKEKDEDWKNRILPPSSPPDYFFVDWTDESVGKEVSAVRDTRRGMGTHLEKGNECRWHHTGDEVVHRNPVEVSPPGANEAINGDPMRSFLTSHDPSRTPAASGNTPKTPFTGQPSTYPSPPPQESEILCHDSEHYQDTHDDNHVNVFKEMGTPFVCPTDAEEKGAHLPAVPHPVKAALSPAFSCAYTRADILSWVNDILCADSDTALVVFSTLEEVPIHVIAVFLRSILFTPFPLSRRITSRRKGNEETTGSNGVETQDDPPAISILSLLLFLHNEGRYPTPQDFAHLLTASNTKEKETTENARWDTHEAKGEWKDSPPRMGSRFTGAFRNWDAVMGTISSFGPSSSSSSSLISSPPLWITKTFSGVEHVEDGVGGKTTHRRDTKETETEKRKKDAFRLYCWWNTLNTLRFPTEMQGEMEEEEVHLVKRRRTETTPLEPSTTRFEETERNDQQHHRQRWTFTVETPLTHWAHRRRAWWSCVTASTQRSPSSISFPCRENGGDGVSLSSTTATPTPLTRTALRIHKGSPAVPSFAAPITTTTTTHGRRGEACRWWEYANVGRREKDEIEQYHLSQLLHHIGLLQPLLEAYNTVSHVPPPRTPITTARSTPATSSCTFSSSVSLPLHKTENATVMEEFSFPVCGGTSVIPMPPSLPCPWVSRVCTHPEGREENLDRDEDAPLLPPLSVRSWLLWRWVRGLAECWNISSSELSCRIHEFVRPLSPFMCFGMSSFTQQTQVSGAPPPRRPALPPPVDNASRSSTVPLVTSSFFHTSYQQATHTNDYPQDMRHPDPPEEQKETQRKKSESGGEGRGREESSADVCCCRGTPVPSGGPREEKDTMWEKYFPWDGGEGVCERGCGTIVHQVLYRNLRRLQHLENVRLAALEACLRKDKEGLLSALGQFP